MIKTQKYFTHTNAERVYVSLSDLCNLLRIKDWAKNLFLFLPIFFSGKLFAFAKLDTLLLGFVAFSFVASAVYIVNDYCDMACDKKHPIKKYRCLAAGKIKPLVALYIAAIALFAGCFFAIVSDNSLQFLWLLLFYFLLNMAYSFKLKNMAVVDVLIIALGFLIRVNAGGLLTGIEVSGWLQLMVFLLSLFMALAKRRDDVIVKLKTNMHIRNSLAGYSLKYINPSLICLAIIISIAYIMYCISPSVYMQHGNAYLYATSIFVIVGVSRYVQIIFEKNAAHSPTEILYKDVVIQTCLLLWVLTFYAILYI